jgi:hypothetical protein
MATASNIQYSLAPGEGEVIYRTVCENPGSGHVFDLSITRSNLDVLGSRMACPRCHRPGGALKRDQKLGDGVLLSRLLFQRIPNWR